MSRTRTGAALALLALALLTLPAGASADTSSPTWAGTWDTDFGRMTLGAGGSGNYVSPFGAGSSGTISGKVDGRVNEGTWKQPNSSGKFRFEMSGSGLTFTGDWEYDQGGCGSSCGWNGECKEGACLKNDDPAPTEPPACGAAAMNALVAAKTCDLGSLPFGQRVTVDFPKPGKTKDISPREIPEETYKLILEILAEQEADRMLTALAAKFGSENAAKDALDGCALVHAGAFEEEVSEVVSDFSGGLPNFYTKTEFRLTGAGQTALFNACARLLLQVRPSTTASARPAARRCHVTVVPLFKKGAKVTKRRIKQARAAIEDRVNASCDTKRKGFVASLKVRGKGATLNRVTGKNIGAPLARFSNTPANGRRTSVRWKAVKR